MKSKKKKKKIAKPKVQATIYAAGNLWVEKVRQDKKVYFKLLRSAKTNARRRGCKRS